MAGTSVYDAIVKFVGDYTELKTGLPGAAAQAGTQAGGVFGSKFGGVLRTTIGALAGAAFGSMLSGANELDAATKKLMADTGMTADQAKVAETAMAGMYQHNLQGFATIGDTLAVVTNGLDLTGAAAVAMTQKFLTFETATGQGAAAVSAFHEILNAWNLTAEAAPGIMDQLVASHQKYGSVVTENQAALLTIAPAMQAMGMSIDDGIGLLNLFDVAGINAAKAPMALQFAIKALKPGQNINDLIAQISAIIDPTERAQAAMKVFGARGGVQMAQAFQPGIKSLNQFKTSVQENTDATQKGADAIDSAFGARATLLLHQFQGALAEVGVNMGDLVMVASLLGPGLTKGLFSILGGLGGLLIPKIAEQLGLTLPAWIAGGTASGTAMGTAAAGAEVATEGAEVAAGQAVVAAEAIPAAAAAGTTIGGAIGAAAALAIPLLIVAAVAGIATLIEPQLHDLALSTHDAIFGKTGPFDQVGSWLDSLPWPIGPVGAPDWAKGSADAGAGAKSVGEAATNGLRYGLVAGAPTVQGASKALFMAASAGMRDALARTRAETIAAAAAIGGDVAQKLADGIKTARAAPLDAFNNLLTMLKTPLSKTSEFARLAGELTSKELAAGLKSYDPEIRAAADAVKSDILTRMAGMTPDAGIIGTDTTKALAAGLKSKNPEIRANALLLKSIIDAALADPRSAEAAGAAAGAAYAAALAKKVQERLAAVLAAILANPQQYADTGGGADYVTRHPTAKPAPVVNPNRRALGGPVTARVPYIVGENGPELFVPAKNGQIVPSGQASAGGGNTYQVNVQGLVKARDPLEIARQLRRFAEFGVLRPQSA